MPVHTQTVEVCETTAFIIRTKDIKVGDLSARAARQMILMRQTIIRMRRVQLKPVQHRYAVDIERADGTWNTHIVLAGSAADATITAFLDEVDKGYEVTGESRVRISE